LAASQKGFVHSFGTGIGLVTLLQSLIVMAFTSLSHSVPAPEAGLTARYSVVNGVAGCSNTTSERPHEFFDQTG
jgi:hypothetical protein